MTDYLPQDEVEAKEFVRTITGYEDNEDSLPQEDLDRQFRLAKMRLHNKTGADDGQWFSDSGLTQALVYSTAILCKITAENITASYWSIGDEQVTTRNQDEDDSPQLQEWNDLVNDGLEEMGGGSSSVGFKNTAEYIGSRT